MTHDEMRIRLAEAMGWTDLYDSAYGILWGTEPATDLGYDAPRRVGIEVPDPLESDRDAALLRAWCVGRGWTVETRHTRGPSMASIAWTPDGDEHFCIVADTEEPDPCRRERVALCRAVLQAIEAGGEA